MLDFYYNSFKTFFDNDKYEELEMDTDSFYLGLSEEKSEDVILSEKRAESDQLRSKHCTDTFTASATGNFLPKTCCNAQREHDKREPGLLEEEFRCAELLCLCCKNYCCYDGKANKYKLSSKRLNKRTLEDCGDGPMSEYRKLLQEAVNVTSNNRGFRTNQHSVDTYEQSKKGLSFFYPKTIVKEDGIHTKPLHL